LYIYLPAAKNPLYVAKKYKAHNSFYKAHNFSDVAYDFYEKGIRNSTERGEGSVRIYAGHEMGDITKKEPPRGEILTISKSRDAGAA
jgi:hypothetical protein